MSLFSKVRNVPLRVASHKMSASATPQEVPGAGALLSAVGATFVTYMTADFLSNFLQHPTQKVSVCNTFAVARDIMPYAHPRSDICVNRWTMVTSISSLTVQSIETGGVLARNILLALPQLSP